MTGGMSLCVCTLFDLKKKKVKTAHCCRMFYPMKCFPNQLKPPGYVILAANLEDNN